jgi:hypothetical protein
MMVTTHKVAKDAEAKSRLFDIGVAALKQQGWTVQRASGSRKPSERLISRKGKSLRATIRTSRDGWLAFPLKDAEGTRFGPLAKADRVLVVTPDQNDAGFALVYDFPADDIRKRFGDAFEARKKAGHAVKGHGMWVSLFRRKGDGHPVYTVGGGVAADSKPIARVPIKAAEKEPVSALADVIAAAKRQIAAAAGIDPSQVRISIEA